MPAVAKMENQTPYEHEGIPPTNDMPDLAEVNQTTSNDILANDLRRIQTHLDKDYEMTLNINEVSKVTP